MLRPETGCGWLLIMGLGREAIPGGICDGIWRDGSTAEGWGGDVNSGKKAVPSGKSWSGWKFSQRDGERLGDVRVTRKKSGGVAGRENWPLNGVVGLVLARELPVPVIGS
jgi:hypothetical protein